MKAILTFALLAISIHAFGQEPTTQASGISFANVTQTSVDIIWTNGNGTNRLVVGNQDSAPPSPTDAIDYIPNATWGLGDVIGSAYVVYEGTGNNVSVTGLSANTTYYFHVFEFDGASFNYLTTMATNNPSNFTTQACDLVNAGSDQPYCFGSSIFMSASPLGAGTGTWSILSGGTGTFANINDAATQFTPDAPGNFTLEWSVTDACGTTTDQVVITVDAVPVVNAGSDQVICGTSTVLAASGLAGGETGSWSSSPSENAIFSNPNDPTSTFDGLAGVTYTLTWNVTIGSCSPQSDQVVIDFQSAPNAGPNNSAGLCNSGVINLSNYLTGPTTYSGTWTQLSGPGSPTLSGSSLDLSTAVAGGYVFEYRISGAPACPDAIALITINVEEQPDAGSDNTVSVCNTDVAFDLLANLVGAPDAGGIWTLDPGAPQSVPITGNTVDFTGALAGTYVFEYFILGVSCSDATAYLTVNLSEAPTINAGTDVEVCESTGTYFLSSASASNYASIQWTSSGTGAYNNDLLLTPTYTFGPGESGSINLVGSVFGSGACSSAFVQDIQVLTITASPFVNQGTDFVTCQGNGNFNIVDATASNYASIQWTTSGSGAFSDPNNLTTTYIPDPAETGAILLTLTANPNGSCSSAVGSKTLTIDPTGTVSNPGNQTLCVGSVTSPITFTGSATSFSWVNDNPSIGLAASGSGDISAFTAINGGSSDITANITVTPDNAGCQGAPETFTITVQALPDAVAGADVAQCDNGNFTLNGNTPSSGLGAWSIVSGSATIVDPTSPTTQVNGLVAGAVTTLRWTVSNASCAAASDDVDLSNHAQPSAADAGSDQMICGASTMLGGTNPATGSGSWSVISGTGHTLYNSPDPTSPMDGVVNQTYTLRWTVTNGTCTPSTDDVQITFEGPPSVPTAGVDQTICATSTSLTANTPTVGSGSWSAVAGAGASFVDNTDPLSGFNGSQGEIYTLRWTISNSCGASSDDVIVTMDQSPTTANAGADQNVCSGTMLDGNTPVVGTGMWSVVSGDGFGSITTPGDINSPFSGTPGQSYTLRWTIANSSCTDSFDDVVIAIESVPTTPIAGTDQTLCGPTAALGANAPVVGAGVWSIVSGIGGAFDDVNDPLTNFTGTEGEVYTLRWTISNACAVNFDDVSVTLQPLPTTSDAGVDINICATTTSLAANAPTEGVGNWTIISGAGGVFMDDTNPLSDFDGLEGETYILRWTIDNALCTPSTDDVMVYFEPAPTQAVAGVDLEICDGIINLSANTPVTGSGFWNSPNGGVFSDASNPQSTFDADPGFYTLEWSVSSGTCPPSVDEITIQINPVPDLFITNLASEIASGATTSILLSSSLPSATYQYFPTASPEVTGAESGFENAIEQVLENNSGIDQIVTYEVTPVSQEGCSGTPQTASVTVLGNIALPTVSEADSLVLVSIYNATNGASWIVNTNWLTGKVNTWHGITVNNFRVTDIQLSANNLSGNLPASIETLDALSVLIIGNNTLSGVVPDLPPSLTYIDLTNNNYSSFGNIGTALQTVSITGNSLTDLPDMTGSPLQLLEVSNNMLTFGDLEPYITVPSFTYAPQAEVEDPLDILVDVASGRTFTATIDGSSNSYTWYKDGILIPGESEASLVLSNIQVQDEGIYHYEASNTFLSDLTLARSPIDMKVSSLKRDSIALRTIYNATGGTGWTNDANWLSTPLATGNWFGVTITDNRVTALSLPGNNVTGSMPSALKDIGNLVTVNLSNNALTNLPVLTSLSGLTTLNVSGNRLHFNSLEQNVGIGGIDYSNQAVIGEEQILKIPVGNPHTLQLNVGGTSNIYTWRRNGNVIAGATSNRIDIASIDRSNMGIYTCDITNSLVPDLTIQRATETAWAVTSISGNIYASETQEAISGTLWLLKINAGAKYDTTVVHQLDGTGAFQFNEIILADYQLAAFVDTITYENALPTYYNNSIYWEEADTIFLNGPEIGIDITSQYLPSTAPAGDGVIRGFLEEPEEEGGRVKANKRVAKAGTSVRRVEGGGRDQEETLELVAYVFTNDNGEFEFQNLEEGEYRLNIQYPGYPMDPNSFVTINVGSALEQEQVVSAIVEEGQIVVRQLIITGAGDEKYVLNVYPNPTSEILKIEFGTEKASRRYVVFNSNGKKVLTGPATAKANEIKVAGLAAGGYLLQILEKDKIETTIRFLIK